VGQVLEHHPDRGGDPGRFAEVRFGRYPYSPMHLRVRLERENVCAIHNGVILHCGSSYNLCEGPQWIALVDYVFSPNAPVASKTEIR
jgi:hypothetical protein